MEQDAAGVVDHDGGCGRDEGVRLGSGGIVVVVASTHRLLAFVSLRLAPASPVDLA